MRMRHCLLRNAWLRKLGKQTRNIMAIKSSIVAIGTAVPTYKQSQQKAAEIVAAALRLNPVEKRLLKSVYRSTGIEYRHSVMSDFCKEPGEYEFFPNDPALPFPATAARMQIYKANALPLAKAAIEDCIASLPGFALDEITHLITVSCTGMYAPGIDIELVHHLHLQPSVKRTCINFMGCYGAFNALKVADVICKAEPNAVVLIVCVELCTLHFQKNESMDNMISNAIFSDGAAAALVQGNARQKNFALEAFHCDLMPQNSNDMAWHITDNGFDIVLSSYVPQAIQSGIAHFVDRLLKQYAMQREDIDLYAIHPGGKKILKACEAALSITPDHNRFSYQVLKENGNMSSATILFVLKAILNQLNESHAQQKIFSCSFGPGLTLESMLLRVGI